MLKDINKRRPDRQLERNLIFLAYAIMFMSLSLFALFIYPQHSFVIVVSTVVWNVMCILITIRILKVSENALGFGALAAEILNDKTKYNRVDNAEGKTILANQPALEYLQDRSVLNFLEENIIDSAANKLDLQKLASAVNKLQPASVVLSINPHKDSVFVAEEWLRVTVKPIFLNKAEIFEDKFSLTRIRKETYIFWSVENITSYKNMEQMFQNEMSSLHDFLDFLPVGLYTCGKDGTVEYVNNTFADYLGLNRSDIAGQNIDSIIAYKPEQLHTVSGTFSGNIMFKTAHGQLEAFVRQQNMREDNELKTRGVVIRNLPNDEELKQNLNKITDKFERLFDTVPVGIILADRNQKIMEINRHTAEIFAKDIKEISGKKVSQYFNEEAGEKIKNAFEEYGRNNECDFNFETAISAGGENKNLQIYISPLKMNYSDLSGEISGMILYMLDITSKRELEMQVAQAQKMQAFGQLAGGVAHDFNNLLTAVISYCELLLQRHGVGDPSFSDLIQLNRNAKQAAGVARQLLTISRNQPLNPKLVDVTDAFAEIEHLLTHLIGEQITFKLNYGTDLGYIRVDPVQFSQVMINLAINAKDAMNGKGTLTVSTREEHLAKPYQFGEDTIKPGDFIVISVSDTGCGIPPENLNRIFEPFFSTKKNIPGSGTGLGLAMVYGIVHQTGGFVKVHSEVGKGTTFEIYLPSYENAAEENSGSESGSEEIIKDKSGKTALSTQPYNITGDDNSIKPVLGMNSFSFDSRRIFSGKTGGARILFVEDEDAVRIVGTRGLKQKGFDVIDCVSAENALEHIENGEKFDMMVTDMMMPGLNGAELAKIARLKIPDLKIILASGYSEEIARKELAGSADFYFIGKPYGVGDLQKKVMEVLAK